MKLRLNYSIAAISVALAALPVLADSNATIGSGDILNSESVTLSGPLFHGGAIGDSSNSIMDATFSGGFNANQVRFSGTLDSLIGPTYASEADIQISNGSYTYGWQNPGGSNIFTTYNYDDSQAIAVLDPNGLWTVEFFDSFNDGPGPDSVSASAQSSNVTMTFEEVDATADSNGTFSLGSLSGEQTLSSIGEFAVTGIFDTYSITLNEAGLFTFTTDEDPDGLIGNNADTEIAIFDSNGFLLLLC